MSTVTDIGIKSGLLYLALADWLVKLWILGAFWPDDSLGVNGGLAEALLEFWGWLGILARHHGKRVKRGKPFRRPRHAAVTA